MADPGSVIAKGVEQRVVFDGSSVTIHPDVFARFRAKVRRRDGRDRVIPIDDIVAVELVASTMMLNGYVRFTLASNDKDEDEDDRIEPPTTAAAAKLASRDPNAVMFSRYQASAFTALHDAIAAAIADRKPR
jgi:hypothetical protein